MPDLDTLSERVRTLERTLTGGEMPELQDDAELRRTTADLTTRMDDLEAELAELDAAVQALRGYVGNIRAVNADVERRADAALAIAEAQQCDSDFSGDDVLKYGTSGDDFETGSNRNSSEMGSNPDRTNITASSEPRRHDHEKSTMDERSLTTRLRELL